MSGERRMVRCFLTTAFVIVGIVGSAVFAVLKALEGVVIAYQITQECIRQVWSDKGMEDFDRSTQG